VRLTHRLDALARHLPPERTGCDSGTAVRHLCELLENHAPIPAGEGYADVDVRLDAVLDRLHAAGVGIPAGPNTSRMDRVAAVYGTSARTLRDELRQRASGGRR
jgi:hypothetical protein